jgi:N-methylhydantoinase A
MLLIGVDTGGTFTDFIWRKGDQWGEYKCLSTPENPAEAVLKGINHISQGSTYQLVHGSTVATNAILEKRGARTALITNRHFEDVIEIARQNRSELYNFFHHKNPPLVPRTLRFGIPGRVDQHGNITEKLSDSDLEALLEPLQQAEVESLAVSLLFSFKNHEHERQVRNILSQLNIPISLSHETLAEFREYERTSTTVINAYVAPKMEHYLDFLRQQIGTNSFRIMQSNGGSISATTAMREPVRTILSGPAGGVVGAFQLGTMAGYERLITFDMGGTSTDVALLDGKLPLTMESSIAEYPVKVPMIDIHTVGAGGGSIASIDKGNALKVGPESAGADPGPICYGKGHNITVTDANLALGRLIPDQFLGGHMQLNSTALMPHFEELAMQLQLSPQELAEGVLSVANITMERAIKVISVERGFDPREFTLLSFGGAGGLHAAYLARELNMTQVLIPCNPGILSAAGMLMADVIKDYSQTVMLTEEEATADLLDQQLAPLITRGRNDLTDEGVPPEQVTLTPYLDMRYQGQSYEILVPYTADYASLFHKLHKKTYGYSNHDKAIEIVNVRLRALGKPDKPQFSEQKKAEKKLSDDAIIGQHQSIFDGSSYKTRVIRRDRLKYGNQFEGPAIVVEYSSTIVVPPFAKGWVDKFGNLILTVTSKDES